MTEDQPSEGTGGVESSGSHKSTVSKAVLLVVAMAIIGFALVVVLWLLLTLTFSLIGSL